MTTTDPEPGTVQAELLPALLDGRDPDAYVVIPVQLLSSLITRTWNSVARDHRGEVREGWFQIKLMRALMAYDNVLVDTAHPGNGMDDQ